MSTSTSTKVLDHGYVQFIESWGSDERIIEAARMSTDKGFEGWGPLVCPVCHGRGKDIYEGPGSLTAPEYINICNGCKGEGKIKGDEKLLHYLYSHKHMTPFEMGGLIIEVQAPIFVFREWHRHRTQSYNELSARYTPIPDVNYVPSFERLLLLSEKNKQAQSLHGVAMEHGNGKAWLHDLETFYKHAEHLYQMGLNMGLTKEIARIVLPVGRYSRMRASANLRNWLAFLTLRMDTAAQWEIRQYANEVGTLIQQTFPRTYELFVEGR